MTNHLFCDLRRAVAVALHRLKLPSSRRIGLVEHLEQRTVLAALQPLPVPLHDGLEDVTATVQPRMFAAIDKLPDLKESSFPQSSLYTQLAPISFAALHTPHSIGELVPSLLDLEQAAPPKRELLPFEVLVSAGIEALAPIAFNIKNTNLGDPGWFQGLRSRAYADENASLYGVLRWPAWDPLLPRNMPVRTSGQASDTNVQATATERLTSSRTMQPAALQKQDIGQRVIFDDEWLHSTNAALMDLVLATSHDWLSIIDQVESADAEPRQRLSSSASTDPAASSQQPSDSSEAEDIQLLLDAFSDEGDDPEDFLPWAKAGRLRFVGRRATTWPIAKDSLQERHAWLADPIALPVEVAQRQNEDRFHIESVPPAAVEAEARSTSWNPEQLGFIEIPASDFVETMPQCKKVDSPSEAVFEFGESPLQAIMDCTLAVERNPDDGSEQASPSAEPVPGQVQLANLNGHQSE